MRALSPSRPAGAVAALAPLSTSSLEMADDETVIEPRKDAPALKASVK